MRILSYILLCLAVLSTGCGSSDICGDDEPDCWLAHLVVEVDGQQTELDEVDAIPGGGVQPVGEQSGQTVIAVGPTSVVHQSGDKPDVTAAPAPLEAAWASAANDLWAVGGTSIFHFDGTSWTAVGTSPAALHAIWGHSASDIWFAGDGGTVLHWTGSGFDVLTVGVSVSLTDIAGRSAEDLWVAGGKFVAHFDGAGFTRRTLSTDATAVTGIWVSDSGRAIFVETSGADIWDGSSFSHVEPGESFSAVTGHGEVAYAVGALGNYVIFDLSNGSFTEANLGPYQFTAIWTDGVTIWAVAKGGALLEGQLPAAPTFVSSANTDLLAVVAVPAETPASSATALPTISERPPPITIDTRSSKCAPMKVSWRSAGGISPGFCLGTCSKTARCSSKMRCSRPKPDAHVSGFTGICPRFTAIPTSENSAQKLRLVPISIAPANATATLPGTNARDFGAGGPVDVDVTVLGNPVEQQSGGGGGGGSGGSCAHCVDGQPCAACGGGIACGGKVCCGSGETCSGGICKSGNGGSLNISVAQCGVGRYTVTCNSNGGCCPTCMTCGSNNDCLLP